MIFKFSKEELVALLKEAARIGVEQTEIECVSWDRYELWVDYETIDEKITELIEKQKEIIILK